MKDRAAHARERLQADAARLSPVTLRHRIARGQDRLDAVRMTPLLATARLQRERERFAALERLYASLDPKAPLARGFVLVKDGAGELVRSRAAAAAEPALEIEFADGSLPVVPAGSAPVKPVSRKVAKRSAGQAPRQDDLFG